MCAAEGGGVVEEDSGDDSNGAAAYGCVEDTCKEADFRRLGEDVGRAVAAGGKGILLRSVNEGIDALGGGEGRRAVHDGAQLLDCKARPATAMSASAVG